MSDPEQQAILCHAEHLIQPTPVLDIYRFDLKTLARF